MKDNIPASALDKLLRLSDAAEVLSEKVIAMEQGIASARQRLSGGMKQTEFDDLRAGLDQMTKELPALKKRCNNAQAIYQKCRELVDTLPKGTVLEPVAIQVDGHDLSSVRTRLGAAQSELAALRAVPTASADIEQRIRAYVQSMARPTISGIAKGEKLKVIWPGAGFGPSGPREDRADILSLMALLHGDKMVEALMTEIERTTSNVVPIKERASRIAALEAELAELAYVEEVLITAAIEEGVDVQRSANALPAAVLQVRVVKAKRDAPSTIKSAHP
jgi:hypothetical protein